MKKRFWRTLITVTVMSSLIVAPVSAAPQDEVESLEKKKSEAQQQVNSVNEELVSLLVDYDAIQLDIKNQGERIDQAEADLKDAEEKEKQQYEDMKLRIKYMYEEGSMGAFLTLLSAKSFSDFISKAEYIQKVNEYDRTKLDEYVQTKNEVVDLKEGLEEGQAELQSMADEMQIQKKNLESTLTEMKSQVEDFDSQLTQAKAAAAEELARLEAEQQTADEQQAAAAQEDATLQADAAGGNDVSNDRNDAGSSQTTANTDKEEKEEVTSKPSGNSDKEENKKPEKEEEEDEKEESSSSSDASLGQQIADMGCKYIGNKYVYGGNSLTNGIDCSGFVQQIHKKFGISTPRTSSALRSGGKSVSYANKLPGDVICYSGHVAIYIGNNQIVHASNSQPYPKGGIKISSPANYRTVLAVRRYW